MGATKPQTGLPAIAPRITWRDLGLRIRHALGLLNVGTMTQGIAPGTRFCAGPSNPDYATGANELPVQHALQRVLRDGGVFFDVGANVGYFTVLAARVVGSRGRVVAFEPVVENAAYARLNCHINKLSNVLVLERAVGQANSIGTLQLARYSGGAALDVAGPPPDLIGTRQVPVVSVDDLLGGGVLPVPDVVKIDVEGAELQVLQGMIGALRTHRPVVLFEVDAAQASQAGATHSACTELLASLGYTVTELDNSYAGINWVVRHALAIPDRSSRSLSE